MKNIKRKGFTIVELVIVIAVIAILAAVLIPTFSNLVEKASISADTQLSKNMNTALSIAEAADGKNATFYDAIADIQAAGYTVEKLTPTSEGCHLVWDQKNDRIVFLDSDKKEIYAEKSDYATSDLWFVAKSISEIPADSNAYLAGTDLTGEITVSNGIDVGANTGITKVNYINTNDAQSVIIRTNSLDSVLNIDAPLDEVDHYGLSKEVNVYRVKMGSLDEYATVSGNINLGSGKVNLNEGATCSNVVLKDLPALELGAITIPASTPTASNVSIEVNTKASVNAVISEKTGVEAEKVATGSGMTDVAKIEQDDTNCCYIGKTGYATIDAALDAAISAAADCNIVVIKNVTTSEPRTIDTNKNIEIDLNGKTFTYTGTSKGFDVTNRSSLIIKNGTLNAKSMLNGSEAFISIATRSTVTVVNLDAETNGAFLFPRGDAAQVNVIGSNINAGTYAVGTNAEKLENYGVAIDIENSVLSAKGYIGGDGDTSTVMINVSGTLKIKNSEISGHRNAVLVRAGVATIENTTITADLPSDYVSKYPNGEWKSGNEVPSYPLVIGDTNKDNYSANAVCTLNGVKVINTCSNADYKGRTVYMAKDASAYTTELTYNADSTVGTIEGLKDCTVIVNGTSKTFE